MVTALPEVWMALDPTPPNILMVNFYLILISYEKTKDWTQNNEN